MNSQKSTSLNLINTNNKKLFFNQTQDEYEDSKITLPSYLQHPSKSQLISGDYSSSKINNQTSKHDQPSLSTKDNHPNQSLNHVSSEMPKPSISSNDQNHIQSNNQQDAEESVEYDEDQESSEFTLDDLQNVKFQDILNIPYLLMEIMTMVQNYSDELIEAEILDFYDDFEFNAGLQRFILWTFHRHNISLSSDEYDRMSLQEYYYLMTDDQSLRDFIFNQYPNLKHEFDVQEETLRFELMTEDQFEEEYFMLFDYDTLDILGQFRKVQQEIHFKYSKDQFSPFNFNPFKPQTRHGPGPLDEDLKNTNFFENIDQFTDNSNQNTALKPPSKPNSSFSVSIRKDKPNTQSSNINKNDTNTTKPNQINFFNLSSSPSFNYKNPPNDEQSTNKNKNKFSFQEFVQKMKEDKNKKIEKIQEIPAQNKASHFDKILGRQSDQTSENFLKPFVGNFYRKEDARQKEFMSQLSQSGYPSQNKSPSFSAIQSVNKEERQKSLTQKGNQLESPGSFSRLSQIQNNETVRANQSQKLMPNFSNNKQNKPNKTNITTIPQQVASSNFSHVFSASRADNASMSPPSFSNLAKAESSANNNLDTNLRPSNNIEKSCIPNPFAPSLNPPSANLNKQLPSNANSITANQIVSSQSPFSKKADQNVSQKTVFHGSPFSKSKQNSQNIASLGAKTPDTPKFGAFGASQVKDSQLKSHSDKHNLALKTQFEGTNQTVGGSFQSKTSVFKGTIQRQQLGSVSFGNTLSQNSLSTNLQSQSNPFTSSLSVGANAQTNMNVTNSNSFQVQNSVNQAQNGFLNSFANNVSSVPPQITINTVQGLNCLSPSVPSIPLTISANTSSLNPNTSSLNPNTSSLNSNTSSLNSNTINLNQMVQTQKRKTQMINDSQMRSEDQPKENKPVVNKNKAQIQNSLSLTPYSLKIYTVEQMMNMKVSDFINGFCRAQMDSMYRDLFQQIIITKSYNPTNYVPLKSLNSKLISLQQNLLDNSSPYNRHRQFSKRTIFSKLKTKTQQLNEKFFLNHSPYQRMNQVSRKLQNAIDSSLTIPNRSFQSVSDTYSLPSEKSYRQSSLSYRYFSFEEDLSRAQRIQDEISSQLQEIEQKVQLRADSGQDREHIYLTTNEELISMMNTIKNTQKWLLQNDYCSVPQENGSIDLSGKQKVQDKAEDETEDFKILKTVYKNLSMIETNVESMSEVLSSI